MNTKKITDSEIADIKIASLPSRPTAPTSFGGKGYTANEMKAAFDRLPLYIIQRFNSLLDDISADDDQSLAAEIPTGIKESHSLKALFEDLLSGELATYLSLGDESLLEMKLRLSEEKEENDRRFASFLEHINDGVIDAFTPTARITETEVQA